MESKSTKSVARSRFLPARPREAVLKGNIMSSTNPLARTCDTCEQPALATYSNGEGTTENVCGYHNYLITRVVEVCTTCNKQAYVLCHCED